MAMSSESATTTLVPDILTCGRCRRNFPLNEFITFLWHKVLGCSGASTDHNDESNLEDVSGQLGNDDPDFDDCPSRTPSTSSAGEPIDSPLIAGVRRGTRGSVDDSRGCYDNEDEDDIKSRRRSASSNRKQFTGE